MRVEGAITLAIGLLAAVAVARPAQARIIGRGAEISIGRETASMVEQVYTVDTDPVAVSRVRQIGRRLSAVAKDPDFPFEFHVVESGEVNAFALPGGFVYVYRGLLQLVPNDDALAFVMAHEISHVTQHHAIRQFEKSLVLNAGISAILAGTGATGFGNAAAAVQEIAGITFTRHDEGDADTQGIRVLTEAGYNPRAAAEAMEIVKRSAGKDHTPALLRTHPATDSRIKKLTEMGETLLASRNAARPVPTAVPPPPPIAAPRVAGLDSLALGPCEWFPLAPGARWVYRLSSGTTNTSLTVRALEPLGGTSGAVYRIEYDFGRVKSNRLIAAAKDRYLSGPEVPNGAADWRLEGIFLEKSGADRLLRWAGMERVKVPAGEWDAFKLEQYDADDALLSTSWYARGVGLIRRVNTATGVAQELTSYNIPR